MGDLSSNQQGVFMIFQQNHYLPSFPLGYLGTEGQGGLSWLKPSQHSPADQHQIVSSFIELIVTMALACWADLCRHIGLCSLLATC